MCRLLICHCYLRWLGISVCKGRPEEVSRPYLTATVPVPFFDSPIPVAPPSVLKFGAPLYLWSSDTSIMHNIEQCGFLVCCACPMYLPELCPVSIPSTHLLSTFTLDYELVDYIADRQRVEDSMAANITGQLLDFLEYLHFEKHICHRVHSSQDYVPASS